MGLDYKLAKGFEGTVAGNIDNIIKAIRASKGNLTKVAEKFKVDRATVYIWVNNSDELKAEVQACREIVVDKAEGVMDSLMDSEDDLVKFKSASYVLGTIGRKRGWAREEYIPPVVEKKSIEDKDSIKKLLDEYFNEIPVASVEEVKVEEVEEDKKE